MTEALRSTDNIEAGGVKFDAGKFSWKDWFGIKSFELVPVEGVKAVAAILGHGAKKYAPRNWEKGMDWSRPFDATIRHLDAWWRGESQDPDSGYSHLWHAACNIFFLIAFEVRAVGKDDRPNG